MMKIKNLFYLALLPLSVAGAVFSYKFISKRLIRGRRVRNAGLLSERDTYILEILESRFKYLAVDGKIETTSKNFLSMYPQQVGELIEARDIARSFSKLHKHYPDIIYKKKVNGKEVRTNAGYLWVYKPKSIDE